MGKCSNNRFKMCSHLISTPCIDLKRELTMESNGDCPNGWPRQLLLKSLERRKTQMPGKTEMPRMEVPFKGVDEVLMESII